MDAEIEREIKGLGLGPFGTFLVYLLAYFMGFLAFAIKCFVAGFFIAVGFNLFDFLLGSR